MNENISTHSIWSDIGKDWPDPVQFRYVKRLSNFPYSPGYIRNLFTGSNPSVDLKQHVFYIGKFPAIRKAALINWLDKRTRK